MNINSLLCKPGRALLALSLTLGLATPGHAAIGAQPPVTALQVPARPWPGNHGRVVSTLFLAPDGAAVAGDKKRPLLVAFGGAEGGNAWAGERAERMRNRLLADGYALLAVGYFGMPDTPARLDRIALEGVREAILKAATNPSIDGRCIALIGGSKGAELALLLASRMPQVKAVAAIVPGNAVFVGHTDTFDTSSFSEDGREVPYVPMTEAAIPALLAGDKRRVFDLMMQDEAAVARARIPVERINGPILFLSATKDELWASREMSDAMMSALRMASFRHHYEHQAIEGGHAEPMRHLNRVREFLNTHFLPGAAGGCQ
jgi:dienelactone hydrolase